MGRRKVTYKLYPFTTQQAALDRLLQCAAKVCGATRRFFHQIGLRAGSCFRNTGLVCHWQTGGARYLLSIRMQAAGKFVAVSQMLSPKRLVARPDARGPYSHTVTLRNSPV
jgi:hypothetical protein